MLIFSENYCAPDKVAEMVYNHNTVLLNTLEQPFLIWGPRIDIRGSVNLIGKKIITLLSLNL